MGPAPLPVVPELFVGAPLAEDLCGCTSYVCAPGQTSPTCAHLNRSCGVWLPPAQETCAIMGNLKKVA